MRIVTWNVNSIRARKARVLDWLTRRELPDVVCLQETKVTDDAFPRAEFEALGYAVTTCGQRTYNGVAILSRAAPTAVTRVLPGDPEDEQARFLALETGGVDVVCLYVPNGRSVDSEKYAYKRAWLARVRAFLHAECHADRPLAVCGDLNIAPHDRDVCDPKEWEDTVLFHPDMRAAFASLCDWGLTDSFRLRHPDATAFSWWDYRQLAFPRNQGLRIDHVLVTRPLAERCRGVEIDRDERKGKGASDHVPVVAEFADPAASLPSRPPRPVVAARKT